MKNHVFKKVMALLFASALLILVFPAGGVQAFSFAGKPKITVEVVNETDIKVKISKTNGAKGYEVWVTSDLGYADYKDDYTYFECFGFDIDEEITDNFVKARTIKKDGSKKRAAVIKNLSDSVVSVKVRAYGANHIYGEFSKTKTVEVKKQEVGYKSSYNFASAKKGDTIKFGTFEQDYPIDGKDPIEWIVLDKTQNGLFVVSKYALDVLPWDKRGGNSWGTSSLRAWLNDKFYEVAFNETEKKMIKETQVVNTEKNPIYGTYYRDTEEKIFLLSLKEVTKTEYGYDTNTYAYDVSRRCIPTKYAIAQGSTYDKDDVQTSKEKKTCWWWLRSAGNDTSGGYFADHAVTVQYGGSIYLTGESTYEYGMGVRPAMWIKLKS